MKKPRWNLSRGFGKLLIVASLAMAALAAGCGNVGHKPRGFDVAAQDRTKEEFDLKATPRKIVIFFDGTANDEGSDTNVKRLHSLITLQNRRDIASLYVLGVGTELDPVGAVTGAGINARVTLAYEFILNHYQSGGPNIEADEIYIFGFSRGAFNARILVTMLNFAGIVEEDLKSGALRKYTPKKLAEAVHGVTFPEFGQGDADRTGNRSIKLAGDLKKLGLKSGGVAVPVKVLGLWDSVEQLGSPPILQNLWIRLQSKPPHVDTDEPNRRYGEKLCNVERAYHALSIDDNRATVFTPLLLSRKHMFEGCQWGKGMLDESGAIKPEALQEVWFSGAHSDVGGGYATSALSGVSLNWMLNRLRCDKLLPNSECSPGDRNFKDVKYVRDDYLGGSHDPTTGIFNFYPKVSRDLVDFSFDQTSVWLSNPASICVHESVVMRRNLIGTRTYEYDQLSLDRPGVVRLEPGKYGKGRPWSWEREIKNSTTIAVGKAVDIQVYPACQFNEPSAQIKGTK